MRLQIEEDMISKIKGLFKKHADIKKAELTEEEKNNLAYNFMKEHDEGALIGTDILKPHLEEIGALSKNQPTILFSAQRIMEEHDVVFRTFYDKRYKEFTDISAYEETTGSYISIQMKSTSKQNAIFPVNKGNEFIFQAWLSLEYTYVGTFPLGSLGSDDKDAGLSSSTPYALLEYKSPNTRIELLLNSDIVVHSGRIMTKGGE